MERPPTQANVSEVNRKMSNLTVNEPWSLYSSIIEGGLPPGQPLPVVKIDPRAGTPIFISLADGSAFVTGSNIINNGISAKGDNTENPQATGSVTLHDLVSDVGNQAVIELPNKDITAKVFWPILQWMDYHFQAPLKPQTRDEKYNLDFFDPFDFSLLQQYNPEELKELIVASDYLDVRNLTDLFAKYIAKVIQDLPQDAIAKYLDLPQQPEQVQA